MELTNIKKGKIIFENKNPYSTYINYKKNNKKKVKLKSVSLSPNSTNYIYNLSQNKTFYPKMSFEEKLQKTQKNRSNIFETKILNLEKELIEKEKNYLQLQKIKKKKEKKQKEEYKKTNEILYLKQKFQKLIKNHYSKFCENFILKANFFNMKIMEYFNGEAYLKQKVNFHKHFRFNSDFEAHSRIKMITDIENIKRNTEFLERLDFEKYFDEKERNYIMRDCNYFIKGISKFNNMKFLKGKKLVDKINEEDYFMKRKSLIPKFNKKKSLMLEKKRLKMNLSFDKIKKIRNKIKIKNENYEERLNDIDKEVKQILMKDYENEKKEENRINEVDKNSKKLNIKLTSLSNEKLKHKINFKFFQNYLPFSNKKEYSLKQNYYNLQRYKEKKNDINKLNKMQNSNEENEKKILNSCINEIINIYKKDLDTKDKNNS